MFTLLTPSALLALLGLLVPVAIHLWNRRPGREVPVGSLRWLAAGANRRLRNLQLEQLWLLLLRAALLAVLAVALAGPVWRQLLPAGHGQILLSPGVLGNPALGTLRPAIDSLRRRGYGLRWLTAGFPKMSGAAWRTAPAGARDSARLLGASDPASSYGWARVQQAANSFSRQPLYVVSSALLRGFQGQHVPLPATVTWQSLPTAVTTTWLQSAALVGDSLQLVLATSRESQTAFRRVTAARPRSGQEVRVAGLPLLRYETDASGSRLALAKAELEGSLAAEFPVAVRTQPYQIIVYAAADFASDARYLQAALRAASAGLPVPLALRLTSTPPPPAVAPDWLLWLADAPLPPAWLEAVNKGTNVWQEAAAPGIASPATLVATAADEPPTALFRRAAPAGQSQPTALSTAIWVDGQGRSVLTAQAKGRGTLYQLHTRLAPAWSTLADNPSLPARLLRVLQLDAADAQPRAATTVNPAEAAHDQRAIDPIQLLASPGGTRGSISAPIAASIMAARQTDLRPWLVLAAGLLFAFERLLARRRARQLSPPMP